MSRHLRILLYNIRYGTGTGWHYHVPFPFAGCFHPSEGRIDRIGTFLEGLDLDILGLLEVDFGSFRHGARCQARELGKKLTMFPRRARKYHRQNPATRWPVFRYQGNAILSRERPARTTVHQLNRGMKRAVMEADFGDFLFLLVHLSLGREARREQLKQLGKALGESPKPVLFGGDCNTFQGERELEDFLSLSGLRPTDPFNHPTWPSRNPRKQLDFLLASPEFSVREFRIPQVAYSDHLPLLCELSFSPEASGRTS